MNLREHRAGVQAQIKLENIQLWRVGHGQAPEGLVAAVGFWVTILTPKRERGLQGLRGHVGNVREDCLLWCREQDMRSHCGLQSQKSIGNVGSRGTRAGKRVSQAA